MSAREQVSAVDVRLAFESRSSGPRRLECGQRLRSSPGGGGGGGGVFLETGEVAGRVGSRGRGRGALGQCEDGR